MSMYVSPCHDGCVCLRMVGLCMVCMACMHGTDMVRMHGTYGMYVVYGKKYL